MTKYVPPAVAASLLGVSTSTLRQYVTAHGLGFIKTPGGQKRYDISDVMRYKGGEYKQRVSQTLPHDFAGPKATPETKGAIYARVSSKKQEDDLKRQITSLQELYPGYLVYRDICSGLNYKRKGLTRLLEHVQSGAIKTVVVAHKDRLARFATEIIEWIINQGRLIIQSSDNKCPEQELTEDLMAIVHVFSCRLNGKRGASGRKKRRLTQSSESSPPLQTCIDTSATCSDEKNDEGLQENLQHCSSICDREKVAS